MQLSCYSDNEWQQKHLIRQRLIHNGSHVHFNSSDYLGLSKHPDIIKAAQEGLNTYGISSRGSGLVNGYYQAHQEFEQAFATFTGFAAALFFPSGYMANLAIAQSLTTHNDLIFYDQLSHASLIDSMRLGTAKTHRFRHKNITHLNRLIESKDAKNNRYILTNSVFSCDGALADLQALSGIKSKHQISLIIDDAHGLGVLGKEGRGTLSHLNLNPNNIFLASYPLSKGFGCYGAMLCGNHDTIHALIQFARTYRYTTAIPPLFATAGLMALDILQKEPWRQETLQKLIAYFNEHTTHLRKEPSSTAIQAFNVGDAEKALTLQKKLSDHGFLVGCLRAPSVPINNSLIRITLTVDHSEKEMNQLIELLTSEKDLCKT